MRRNRGIWPPSKPRRTPPPARAFWPLFPLPAVLPWPEPTPRPSRLFFLWPFGARILKPSMSANLLHVEQVRHGTDHPEDGRSRVVLDDRIDLPEAEGPHGGPVSGHAADRAVHEPDPQFLLGTLRFPARFFHDAHPHMSFRVRPRFAAITRGSISESSPWNTAFTVLMAFEEPRDLDRTSRIPAASITARTGPPAMTPVPGAAGFRSTWALLNFPITWCGRVAFLMGTRTMLLFAFSMLLRMASDTSFAFPKP